MNENNKIFLSEVNDLISLLDTSREKSSKMFFDGTQIKKKVGQTRGVIKRLKESKNVIVENPKGKCYYKAKINNADVINTKIVEKLKELQKKNIIFQESPLVNKIIEKNKCLQKEKKELYQLIEKSAKNVFLVYGHATSLNRQIVNLLESEGFTVHSLAERPIRGWEFILEAMKEQAKECMSAVAICSADDLVENNNVRYKQARPNVYFEIGYLYAYYGGTHLFIVKEPDCKNCSDLNGIRYITSDNLTLLVESLKQATSII